MKKVQVLLSSYNGEKYLKEQLNSILNQDYPDISILVRDDGSVDGTVGILEDYIRRYDNISYYKGNNIGVISSFFDLLNHADMSAEYYALSDQDDVWLKGKISRAAECLNGLQPDKPLLYCGRTCPVDENLKKLESTIRESKIVPDFRNALVENICIGCTGVLNRELLKLVREHKPAYTVMHDWWFYLTASAFGDIYFDDEAYILYRQHQGNIIGTKMSYLDEFKKRFKNYKGNRGNISRQAAEFDNLYKVNKEQKQLLDYVINARHNFSYRLKILFSSIIYRQRSMDNMIFKVLFLFGKV